MKVSINWLKEFTDIKLEREELLARIGERLGAIEHTADWGSYFDENIVVAEIIEATEHPNADKLGKYQISTGNENRQVIAGDKTLKKGDKVAYIPPGSRVPQSVFKGEPFKIESREMRGEVSDGMLGSGAELLLNENHEKVQVLDTEAEVGTSLIEAYDLDDFIFDVENKMFTHRPDCFGILGVAREVAGIQNIQFKSPDWYTKTESDFTSATTNLDLEIDNQIPELCNRFTAIALSDVQVKDSPLKMQSMLMRVGLRPINNVVDVTNFVMHLTAQPLHAFDYDKIKAIDGSDGVKIVVRKPNNGEKISLLDGREIELHDNAMLVCSDTKALSVAGSMGGAESEVDEKTANVVLEVATWDMYAIRRTSFEHGIFTDAVARFNKGQSADQCMVVSDYATKLLVENATASIAGPFIDNYPVKRDFPSINVSNQFVNDRLGSEFSAQDIANIISTTELGVTVSGEEISVTPPFWRQDLKIAEDIVEEVGRLYGFDNLPVKLPYISPEPQSMSNSLNQQKIIQKILVAAGANELQTYNFVSDKEFARSGLDSSRAYHIRNALAPELQYMRTQLLPSLLEKIYPNLRQGFTEFALFEMGKAHNKSDLDSEQLPIEHRQLSFVYSAGDNSVDENSGAAYFTAKKYVDYLLHNLKISNLEYTTVAEEVSNTLKEVSSLLDESRRTFIKAGSQIIGCVGEATSKIKAAYKLPSHTAMFVVDLDALQINSGDEMVYKQLSKFPSTEQDATFVTSNNVAYSEIIDLIGMHSYEDGLEVSVEPVTIFRAEGYEDSRNITLRFKFQHHDKTLKTDEVTSILEEITQQLSKKLNITRN
jgi:phenylalanyl-tRNA synthetase beta chain